MEERVAACLFFAWSCLFIGLCDSSTDSLKFIDIHWSSIIIYFQSGAFSQLNWRQISSILSAKSPTKIYKKFRIHDVSSPFLLFINKRIVICWKTEMRSLSIIGICQTRWHWINSHRMHETEASKFVTNSSR